MITRRHNCSRDLGSIAVWDEETGSARGGRERLQVAHHFLLVLTATQASDTTASFETRALFHRREITACAALVRPCWVVSSSSSSQRPTAMWIFFKLISLGWDCVFGS